VDPTPGTGDCGFERRFCGRRRDDGLREGFGRCGFSPWRCRDYRRGAHCRSPAGNRPPKRQPPPAADRLARFLQGFGRDKPADGIGRAHLRHPVRTRATRRLERAAVVPGWRRYQRRHQSAARGAGNRRQAGVDSRFRHSLDRRRPRQRKRLRFLVQQGPAGVAGFRAGIRLRNDDRRQADRGCALRPARAPQLHRRLLDRRPGSDAGR